MRTIEKRPRLVLTGSPGAESEAENLLGEFSALLRQIGAPVGEAASGGAFDLPSSKDSPGPEIFLRNYLESLLLSVELPAIAQACGHALRGELRELIAQDQRLAAALRPTPFAGPSQQVGRARLTRMRPLRDDRLVQRYLKAVEFGQAHGWHTLVYGVTLAVYSLPLRQGLLFYAQETMAALAGASAGGTDVLGDLMERLPAAVSASIAAAEAGAMVQS